MTTENKDVHERLEERRGANEATQDVGDTGYPHLRVMGNRWRTPALTEERERTREEKVTC